MHQINAHLYGEKNKDKMRQVRRRRRHDDYIRAIPLSHIDIPLSHIEPYRSHT